MEALSGLSVVVIIGVVFFLILFTYFVPIGLFITAYFSGVKLKIFRDLVGMRLRKVSPTIIVRNLISATKAGLKLEAGLLEAHYLAGGNVTTVVNALIKYKISGGPVVNDKNELVGIISEGDCIKQISDSRYYNMPMANNTIDKFMIKNVETIDGNLNIFDAASKFLKTKRRRFPIVVDGKLVGQISQKDVLIAAMQLKQQHWK